MLIPANLDGNDKAIADHLRFTIGDPNAEKALMHEGFERIILKEAGDEFLVPKGIAKEIKAITELRNTPEQWHRFLRKFKKVQDMWKAHMLAVYPDYTVRNTVSNWWNNYLAGMGPEAIGHYDKALELQYKYRVMGIPMPVDDTIGKGTRKYTMVRVMEEAERLGVIGSGFMQGEAAAASGLSRAENFAMIRSLIPERFYSHAEAKHVRYLKKKGIGKRPLEDKSMNSKMTESLSRAEFREKAKAWKIQDASNLVIPKKVLKRKTKGVIEALEAHPVLNPDLNVWVRAGYDVNQIVEENARLAHFLWRLSKGDSARDAAKSVNKYLFDYMNGLSEFENRYFRGFLMPFYTWTRFNMPLQLEMLIKKPQKFAQIGKGKQLIEDQMGGPEGNDRFQAEWMKRMFGVRWHWDEKKNQYGVFMLNSFLPAADLQKFFDLEEIRDTIVSLATPGIKLPLEILWKYDTFRGRPIVEQGKTHMYFNLPGDKKVPVHWVAGHLLRSVRFLNSAHNFFADNVSNKQKFARLVIGRSYPYNPTDQKMWWTRNLRNAVRELKSQRSQDISNGETADIKYQSAAIEEGEWLIKTYGSSTTTDRFYNKKKRLERRLELLTYQRENPDDF